MRDILSKSRVLIVVSGCPHCRKYKEFIERINLILPLDKQIQVMDASKNYDLNVSENSLINLFLPYCNNSFPVLFFEGEKLDGSNSRDEAEAWIRGRVHNEFIVPENNRFIFNKDCKFVKKGVFNRKVLVCN